MLKKEILSELWNNITLSNIYVIDIPGGLGGSWGEVEKDTWRISRIFSNWMQIINPQVQQLQNVFEYIYIEYKYIYSEYLYIEYKKTTPIYVMIKLLKTSDKEKKS